ATRARRRPTVARRRRAIPQPSSSPPRATRKRRTATRSRPTSFAASSRRARRSDRAAASTPAAGSRSRRWSERSPRRSSRRSGRPSATPSRRRRAGRPSPTRLYRSRVREARDVATLFLLDMSASTDEPLAPAGADSRPGRRIIDALREALVIMTEALHELGDAYAIYGFSGQGRANVEFYLVKGFGERLGPAVKARIGGVAPKRSTRMGAALRHATRKLTAVGARAKHLMLL